MHLPYKEAAHLPCKEAAHLPCKEAAHLPCKEAAAHLPYKEAVHLFVLSHVQHELMRARSDQRAALDGMLQRERRHVAVPVARSLAMVLDKFVAAAMDAPRSGRDGSSGSIGTHGCSTQPGSGDSRIGSGRVLSSGGGVVAGCSGSGSNDLRIIRNLVCAQESSGTWLAASQPLGRLTVGAFNPKLPSTDRKFARALS